MARALRIQYPGALYHVTNRDNERSAVFKVVIYGGDTQNGKMEYKKQIIDDLTAGVPVREQIVGQSILGSKKFVSWVREK